MSDPNGREYVLATARELYGRVVYSHKVHEKEREIWSDKACAMNWRNIFLASLTTVLSIVSLAIDTNTVVAKTILLVLTALAAAISTAFVLYQASFDPVAKENRHRVAAKELLCLREELLLLIVRCKLGREDTSHLQLTLESLTRQVSAIYKFLPDTSPPAYAKARASLKDGEMTFNDAEIDAFLPRLLRNNTGDGSL
jgi:uncharacterized membrane-anchored protein